jgi:hypothetical protein
MKRLLSIITVILFFSSCYEQTITVNSDRLNGKINYKVEYNKEFENFISYTANKKDIDLNTSILFDRNKLRLALDKASNLNLTYYNLTEKDNSKISESEINFDKVENLSSDLPALYFPTTIYENNMVIYCQTLISIKKIINFNLLALSPEEQATLNNYLSVIKFTFVYKMPNNIIKANRGRLLLDKKTLVYEIYLSELLKLKDDIDITLSYRR